MSATVFAHVIMDEDEEVVQFDPDRMIPPGVTLVKRHCYIFRSGNIDWMLVAGDYLVRTGNRVRVVPKAAYQKKLSAKAKKGGV